MYNCFFRNTDATFNHYISYKINVSALGENNRQKASRYLAETSLKSVQSVSVWLLPSRAGLFKGGLNLTLC